MKESISVFFPLYNEEGNLERLVARALEVLPGLGADFEVILVDDGSRDQTAAIADRIAARDPRVRVVHHPVNGGYGAALRTGFAAARHPLVFFADGDNQFDLGEIGLLIDRIDGADVVSGYRIQRQDPWYRRLNSWLYNRAARVLFDIPVCGVDEDVGVDEEPQDRPKASKS